MTFEELREKHSYISFDQMVVSEDETDYEVTYDYSIDQLDVFQTTWRFPKKSMPYFTMNDQVFKRMLFDLGMVEMISYYKITCPKEIRVKVENLNEKQVNFYKKLIFNGLGEFLYRNHIDITMDELCHFKSVSNDEVKYLSDFEGRKGILLPVGGGKDSITSLEILKKSKEPVKAFLINGRGAMLGTCAIAGVEYIDVKRVYDPKIVEYNKKGYLNGHIPFSSVVAFAALVVAEANHFEYIALSNEDSANESSVIGSNVNHQYSKSLEFENDFREYNAALYGEHPQYFSLLRPFSEYQIGKYFAKHDAYFETFKSCNLGSKEDKWCNNCAKCLYVYVLLSAFLSKETLWEIFHDDLLEREDLLEMFYELIGERVTKPFECVGSIEEICFAIMDGIKRYEKEGKVLPLMYQKFMELPKYEELKHTSNPYANFFNEENNVPEQFKKLIREEMIGND